ncbi:MAG TPA: nitroreductase family protein [Bryobacteraceae bacterium]|nr:nitroreductase family protein [Bryobacteraceae bacterium]
MKTNRRDWMCAAGAGLALSRKARAITAGSPNPLLELFAQRQSVRQYKPDPIPAEHLRLILDAARRAPTAMNQQPWKFLVICDREKILRMKQRVIELTVKTNDPAARQKAIASLDGYFSAPVYVVVLTDNQCISPEFAKHDGPLAAGYLMLAARALGYGTVYIAGTIPESVTREVLNIPARYTRVCITPLGIPDGWPPPRPKKKLEDLVAYESL